MEASEERKQFVGYMVLKLLQDQINVPGQGSHLIPNSLIHQKVERRKLWRLDFFLKKCWINNDSKKHLLFSLQHLGDMSHANSMLFRNEDKNQTHTLLRVTFISLFSFFLFFTYHYCDLDSRSPYRLWASSGPPPTHLPRVLGFYKDLRQCPQRGVRWRAQS